MSALTMLVPCKLEQNTIPGHPIIKQEAIDPTPSAPHASNGTHIFFSATTWHFTLYVHYLTQNKMNLFVLSGHGSESFVAFLNDVILQKKQRSI